MSAAIEIRDLRKSFGHTRALDGLDLIVRTGEVDQHNGVVLLGPPVPGTRAAQLASGTRRLKIHGRYVPVRAEVTALGSTGEFAGPAEVLAWATATPPPETALVVEGEAAASQVFAKTLHAEAG
jgi:metallo-beta-lactamase family protein